MYTPTANSAAHHTWTPLVASDRIRTLCITVLGSGFLRPANATWGSAAVIVLVSPFFLAVLLVARSGGPGLTWLLDVALLTPVVVLATLLSIWWGDWAMARFQAKDPRPFVLDEMAGQCLALLALPPVAWFGFGSLATVLFSQFILFRVFDVLKLPPARQLESLPAGWGIVCDDLVAGLFANLVGQVAWRFTPLAAALGIVGGAA